MNQKWVITINWQGKPNGTGKKSVTVKVSVIGIWDLFLNRILAVYFIHYKNNNSHFSIIILFFILEVLLQIQWTFIPLTFQEDAKQTKIKSVLRAVVLIEICWRASKELNYHFFRPLVMIFSKSGDISNDSSLVTHM